MVFFEVKKISIKEEWQKLFNKYKKNIISFTLLLTIVLSALTIITSILVVNSDFGQKLLTCQKILLVCGIFFGLALLFFIIFISVYFIKFIIFKLINFLGKITNYELLYLNYNKEVNIKNTINIPHLEIPNYRYFKLMFQNNEKRLESINFKIGIESDENWNIKIGLIKDNIDIFYIILHTRMPNDNSFPTLAGDKGDCLNIALQNKDLNEDRQYLTCLRDFLAHKLSSFKLEISDNKDSLKEIKYFINNIEIKLDDRNDIIGNEALHKVSIEIWSSHFRERNIKVNAIFQDLKIIWK